MISPPEFAAALRAGEGSPGDKGLHGGGAVADDRGTLRAALSSVPALSPPSSRPASVAGGFTSPPATLPAFTGPRAVGRGGGGSMFLIGGGPATRDSRGNGATGPGASA